MRMMQKAASGILAAAVALCLCLPISAAGYSYYAVSGVINDDGTGTIDRVEILDGVVDAANAGGMDYVVVAEDYDYNTLDSYAFSVKFSGYADGIGTVSSVPYMALLPYQDEFFSFSLRDASNSVLAEIEINNEITVSDFQAVQNDDAFSLSWSGEDGLSYDVTAVSDETGRRDVLLYRTQDTEAEIPFDWVAPNDTIYFELAAQNGQGTSVLYSDSFATPEGTTAEIADADADDALSAETQAGELTEDDVSVLIKTVIIVGGVIVAVIIMSVVMIILAIKKKRNKEDIIS